MNVGITLLIVLAVVGLAQSFLQGSQRRREHRDLLDRLDRIEKRIGS